MAQQFHYSAQIRRWIIQIIRVFNGIQVEYGLDNQGNQLYNQIPIIWGDGSLQAATIQRLNSENKMPSVPMISIYINNLKYDSARRQDPTYVERLGVRTREYDAETNSYLPGQANAYTVKRIMPSPYNLEIKMDILTSNTQQKLQILEQILPLFNPSIDIQNSDNYLSWESLSRLELTDVAWSNRSIPVGQGNDTSYDVTTLSFESPIWLTLPAAVSKLGVIFQVITSLSDLNKYNDILLSTRQEVSFNNYGIFVNQGVIKLLNQGITTTNMPGIYGEPLDWRGVLSVYGNIHDGLSEIRLTYDNDENHEIVGTITLNPLDTTSLLYTVDETTLPVSTLPPITAIVNPQQNAPGINGFPIANIGQSYLLTGNLGLHWPCNSNANTINIAINDIITYDGTNWDLTFSAKNNTGNIQFVDDLASGLQYKWTGSDWILGWDNQPYSAANWRIII
jgi:hypothetical protein